MRTVTPKFSSLLIFLLLLTGLQFLFLVSYAPFLHNHPINQRAEGVCPAQVINLTLLNSGAFLLFVVLLVFPQLIEYLPLISERKVVPAVVCTHFSRSPPCSIS